jgi:hypothetical protein
MDGPKYRRSKIALPGPETKYLSITTVYMNSQEMYSGNYHKHPYGEINCVVQIDPTAELKGMQGWQGAGWTSPGPGTHHYPQVRLMSCEATLGSCAQQCYRSEEVHWLHCSSYQLDELVIRPDLNRRSRNHCDCKSTFYRCVCSDDQITDL